ncbi:hypothetical protein AOL_s00006g479 [Orbilia oligospora ATCC 24927]|uniref:Uncharacterized protein n=1 Tax=Arthrobotrys oligospora (strain ATCC 24927 / CBS 115.81 / DSM 1491) TaxID=756982 RepID=G1X0S8_ARTOA|nr:hypothetical protein AOL_s00006g479 [Orbilia oligospora ATCC 24927]EGX53218.1 hypothetical protein AOL_s00006g479 [Orbilia oligospora ATCC 24927]
MFRNTLIGGTKFRPDEHIPDLNGKVILVTGGNSGLGLETVRQLVKHNPSRIYLAARSTEKAQVAIQKLQESHPTAIPVSHLSLDLSSFDSIKAAVAVFKQAETRLDTLINNAGVMMLPEGLTKDGYEIQLGTNHLGHALLTQLLLPMLQSTTKLNSDVRVVTVSSGAESFGPKKLYPVENFKTTMPGLSTQHRYAISKAANIHYSSAMAQKFKDIKFVCVHPGSVQTNLADAIWKSSNVVFKVFLVSYALLFITKPEQGALNQLWASVSQDAVSGEFYHPVGLAGKGSHHVKNSKEQKQLWDWTQAELEAHLPATP